MAAQHGGSGKKPTEDVRVESESASELINAAMNGSMSQQGCVDGIRSALQHPTVRFLKERMEKAGCQVWPRFIHAAICNSAGGYSSGTGREYLSLAVLQ